MPTRKSILALGLLLLSVRTLAADPPGTTESLTIEPADIRLIGRDARQRLIVTGVVEGRRVDLTRSARLRSEAPGVVEIDESGRLVPRSDGLGEVVAEIDGREARVSVTVEGSSRPIRPTFERDIQPILSRAGCNSGPCHGKAQGQNGFRLSLLGFDPGFDHAAIARDAHGRRALPAAPERSLVLLKGAAELPHGGGPKLEPGGEHYETLRLWIAAGMPRDPVDAPELTSLSLAPAERRMEPAETQQLVVTAHYADGSTRDVTGLAAFASSESVIVAVDEHGLVRAGNLPGEAAITARFEGRFASCDVSIPLPGASGSEEPDANLPRYNMIDDHVWAKLARLGLTPSEPAGDETFARRAYLDVIGRLPTPEETRNFLDEPAEDRRANLIDALLDRPEYADHWATKWADLLRPNPYRVGIKAVRNLDRWIREAFRRNMPYDQFARELVTGRGSTFLDGPAVIFRDRRDPEEAATMISQLFLGVRLDCARCHHHPFEVWSQDDFYGFAAFFARIGRKGTGLSPPISGSEEVLFTAKTGTVKHPITGESVEPKPLFGEVPTPGEDDDPRDILADWMTSPENPYFARVIVNRVWADLMGVGLVDPVDDLRATNPASNAALLDALADDFRASGHDLKTLIRTIMSSHVYGLSTEPHSGNATDSRNYARHYRERLRAEVLLGAIDDVTGVPEDFDAAPPGTRATALWTVRTNSLFLDAFGRPDPNQDPPCERTTDTSVVQALHLMNSPRLHAKITDDKGRAAALAASDRTPSEIVEELYLHAYTRRPTAEEQAVALGLFGEEPTPADRRRATEDLMWALINTPEFVFKD